MTPARIAMVINLSYMCVRDAVVWAIALYLLNAPEWTFGVLGTLAAVWTLLILKGTLAHEARKRPSDVR